MNLRQYYRDKKLRMKRNEKWEPRLIEIGAIKKSDGIYEINGWFCYPTKGFAMNKENNKKRIRISRLLKRIQEAEREI